MSTKQTIIFTFMILFLAVLLFSLGAWFHLSTELDIKKKTIEALNDEKARLTVMLDNNTTGLKHILDDPTTGLKVQRDNAERDAKRAKDDQATGAEPLRVLYEQKEEELKEQWPKAGQKWKALYEDWNKQNAEIDANVVTLKKANEEKGLKQAEAESDLAKELANEETKRKEFIVKRKAMNEEIQGLRSSQEDTQQKISDVTRDVKKSNTITPLGHVVYASEAVHMVTIDLGSKQGIHKGLEFDIYQNGVGAPIKKGTIEIVTVRPSAADGIILPPKVPQLVDPQTGWVQTDSRQRYSPFSTVGADGTDAQELVKPTSKQDRIEAYRLEKLRKEIGAEKVEDMQREKESPTTPPVSLGKGFVPIIAGDWISNPDFVPIVPDGVYQKKAREELLAMRDINLGSLTFFFTDSVSAYRRESLKRMCERNLCKTADVMGADVSYIVTSAENTNAKLLADRLSLSQGKEDAAVTEDVRKARKTLAALQEGAKTGARVVSEEEVEGLFAQRQRKTELLRGKTIQPGQHTFYVAGQTRDRSVEQVKNYVKDHGGFIATDLDASIDYVIIGNGLDQPFFEKIKRMGLRIIREDELPRFFGVQ